MRAPERRERGRHTPTPSTVGPTASRVRQLLALRGRLVMGIPAERPDPTELRLELDLLFGR